ncbi:MAG: secreted protein [Candidatus Angelobacter sp.]|jgi:mannose-6-phosphate isomerase-like protein (cupin superfamily)|nr:secreted protein [Candidatus Angelobacter sp.]
MRRLVLFCTAILCLGFTTVALAQDPLKVDPKHYTLVSENDQVRILKIHYGPHEKSVMHSHPSTVVVFLSDSNGKFTFPDGKTEDFTTKTGEAMYGEAGTHLPENTGDKPLDGILVELKGKAGAAKPAAAAKPATTAKATKK